MKVRTEEVKTTRLMLTVNTLGVFGRDSDEVFIANSINNSIILINIIVISISNRHLHWQRWGCCN